MMKKILGVFALAMMMVSTAGATTLGPIGLDELVDNGWSIQVGDKLFTDFTFHHTCNGPGACAPADASGIQVTGVTSGDLIGLRFSGGIVVQGGITSGITVGDWLIGYTATVVGTNQLISDMHLTFNGDFSGSLAQATVTETIFEGGTLNELGQIKVTNPPKQLTAFADLAYPVKSIDVLKDIRLTVNGTFPDYADISFIDQYLSQTGEEPQVPEPGTYAMMGAGLIALAAIRRRKS